MLIEHIRSALDEDAVRLRHSDIQERYREITMDSNFTTDWFTGNIPFWIEAFQKLDKSSAESESALRILEIGSFEGRSTIFFASTFECAVIDCVDTWQGSDEHGSAHYLSDLYDRFVENTKGYKPRIAAYQMTSADFFTVSRSCNYDLVYVDGSHRASDVLLDLVNGFSRLRNGGILLIDDYLWKHYDSNRDNPCIAVNSFCRIYRGQFKFLRVGYQVYLKKTIS